MEGNGRVLPDWPAQSGGRIEPVHALRKPGEAAGGKFRDRALRLLRERRRGECQTRNSRAERRGKSARARPGEGAMGMIVRCMVQHRDAPCASEDSRRQLHQFPMLLRRGRDFGRWRFLLAFHVVDTPVCCVQYSSCNARSRHVWPRQRGINENESDYRAGLAVQPPMQSRAERGLSYASQGRGLIFRFFQTRSGGP